MAFTPFITRAENEVLTNELIDLRLTGSTGGALFGVTDNLFTADRAVDFNNNDMNWSKVGTFSLVGEITTERLVNPENPDDYIFEFIPDGNVYGFGDYAVIFISQNYQVADSFQVGVNDGTSVTNYTFEKVVDQFNSTYYRHQGIFSEDSTADYIDYPTIAYPNIKLSLPTSDEIIPVVSVDSDGNLVTRNVTANELFSNGSYVETIASAGQQKNIGFVLRNPSQGTYAELSLSTNGTVYIGGNVTVNGNPVTTSVSYESSPEQKFYSDDFGNILIPTPAAVIPTLDAIVKANGGFVVEYGPLQRFDIGTDRFGYEYVQTFGNNQLWAMQQLATKSPLTANRTQHETYVTLQDSTGDQRQSRLLLFSEYNNGVAVGGFSIGSQGNTGSASISFNQVAQNGIRVNDSSSNIGLVYQGDYSAYSVTDSNAIPSSRGVRLLIEERFGYTSNPTAYTSNAELDAVWPDARDYFTGFQPSTGNKYTKLPDGNWMKFTGETLT